MEMDQLKALPVRTFSKRRLKSIPIQVGLDGKRLFEEQKQNEQN